MCTISVSIYAVMYHILEDMAKKLWKTLIMLAVKEFTKYQLIECLQLYIDITTFCIPSAGNFKMTAFHETLEI